MLGNDSEFSVFIDTFYDNGIPAPSVIHWMYNIKEKINLLYDEQNKNAIIDTVLKKEYYRKLTEI